jgi:hypothetical protein
LIASISGLIPLGVMSGVPVMNSWLRFELTVLPPFMPAGDDDDRRGGRAASLTLKREGSATAARPEARSAD